MYANNDDREYKAYLKQYILSNAPYKISDNGQPVYKLVDDQRVTRFGAFLRKHNLDELPQLLNILKGEMSFIGPRPDVPFSVSLYNNCHLKRMAVLPGITGLWQVSRRKGLSFDDMVKLDLEYIKRLSPALDLKIVLLTIRAILIGDGS
jgi:lipopolysaccharide/colanic/teichoic acid biosynthesis glycosyltransferase